MRFFPMFFMMLAATFSLTSCQKKVYYDVTAPSFNKLTPFALDVAEIRIIDDSPTVPGNHIEDQFPTTPKEALTIWINDRLKAAGQDGTLEARIIEASAVEEPLKIKKGLKGAFTKEPSERYTVTMELELRIYKGAAISKANVRARVTGTREAMEGSGPERRREIYAELVRNLSQEINNQLENRIYEVFQGYLKRPGSDWN